MNLSVYFVTPDGASDALVLAALRGGATVIQFPRIPGSFRGDVPYHDVSGSDV